MTNTEQALPDHFKFVESRRIGTEFTANRVGDRYVVRWGSVAYSTEDGFGYSLAYAQQRVTDGDWIITSKQDQTKAPEASLISRIKAFTEVTNSSVFIHDGFYEVYYNGVDAPAKAETDEDLEKLMNAVVVLYEAT